MNLIQNGLLKFKARKNLSNTELAKILGCSVSVVSQYICGRSGVSLEKLELLIQNGMTIDEAFTQETAAAIRGQMREETGAGLSELEIVRRGLWRLLELSRASGGE